MTEVKIKRVATVDNNTIETTFEAKEIDYLNENLIKMLFGVQRVELMKHGEMLHNMMQTVFGGYSHENYEKVLHIIASLCTMGIVTKQEADRILSELDRIEAEEVGKYPAT